MQRLSCLVRSLAEWTCRFWSQCDRRLNVYCYRLGLGPTNKLAGVCRGRFDSIRYSRISGWVYIFMMSYYATRTRSSQVDEQTPAAVKAGWVCMDSNSALRNCSYIRGRLYSRDWIWKRRNLLKERAFTCNILITLFPWVWWSTAVARLPLYYYRWLNTRLLELRLRLAFSDLFIQGKLDKNLARLLLSLDSHWSIRA